VEVVVSRRCRRVTGGTLSNRAFPLSEMLPDPAQPRRLRSARSFNPVLRSDIASSNLGSLLLRLLSVRRSPSDQFLPTPMSVWATVG
jgi:hypothetical protein